MLLPEFLRMMAERFPGERAYKVVDDGSLTFAEWDEEANRLARGLLAAGIQPGERVAMNLHPTGAVRWLTSYPAIHRAGGVAVPLNPRLAQNELTHIFRHSGTRFVVTEGSLIDHNVRALISSARQNGVNGVATVIDASSGTTPEDSAGRSRAGQSSRSRDDSASGASSADAACRVLAWSELLDADSSSIQVPRDEDDLADILYTSGTTGSPKGVAVRFSNASMVHTTRPSWNGGKWITSSPMFTFAGNAFVYNPMKLGMSAVYQPRFDSGRWLEVVEEERPVAAFLVPAMAQLLLDHPQFDSADLSSIQICTVGSAPLAPSVLERLQARMPDALVSNNYGMTEAGSAYCIMPKGEAIRRPGSVGIPAPPAEVRIADDQGNDVATGQIGNVLLRMPGRPREYFGDPEATAATWVGGWLQSGDLGRIDEDGYLYIVGRTKDVIIRGGNNVHAVDVEHTIVSHDDVLEAAVVGVEHPVLGEDLVAFVVPRVGRGIDTEELREYCLRSLADYKVPRKWMVVDDLPRNATGKVIKAELRTRLQTADR